MARSKEALREEMGAARDELMAAVGSLADGDWDRPTANPEWTARDILTHLAVAEAGNLARMKRILSGNSELPVDWDLNRYNNRQVEKRRGMPIGELVTDLGQSRETVVAFLDGLNAEQLGIRGWHGSGRELTLEEIFVVMANHERGHARDILTAKRP